MRNLSQVVQLLEACKCFRRAPFQRVALALEIATLVHTFASC